MDFQVSSSLMDGTRGLAPLLEPPMESLEDAMSKIPSKHSEEQTDVVKYSGSPSDAYMTKEDATPRGYEAAPDFQTKTIEEMREHRGPEGTFEIPRVGLGTKGGTSLSSVDKAYINRRAEDTGEKSAQESFRQDTAQRIKKYNT